MTRQLMEFFNILSGFRKFVIMMILIIVGIIFRVTDVLTGGEFVSLLSGTVVAYFSANSVEHLTDVAKDWVASKVTPEAPTSSVDNPEGTK